MSSNTSQQTNMRTRVTEYILALQNIIVEALQKVDPSSPPFKRDSWTRPQGGSGHSCVFAASPESEAANNSVLEKAGVNTSIVHGMLPPAAIKQMRADHSSIPYDPNSNTSLPFFAAGLSLVIHPRNPHAPTVHANYRYFEITESPTAGEEPKPGEPPDAKILAWWFGGGSDLTPSYLYQEDAQHFHSTLRRACDSHGSALYPAFKKWCDEYFFIPHRNETRGIGGIFFDDLSTEPHKRLSSNEEGSRPRSPEEIWTFVQALGDSFVPSYIPILERRKNSPSTEKQRRWQLLRRGRYVEFNLVYDRGTKFGLMTPGARIESILMSLPETARWEYMSDIVPESDDSEESKLLAVLKKPADWT